MESVCITKGNKQKTSCNTNPVSINEFMSSWNRRVIPHLTETRFDYSIPSAMQFSKAFSERRGELNLKWADKPYKQDGITAGRSKWRHCNIIVHNACWSRRTTFVFFLKCHLPGWFQRENSNRFKAGFYFGQRLTIGIQHGNPTSLLGTRRSDHEVSCRTILITCIDRSLSDPSPLLFELFIKSHGSSFHAHSILVHMVMCGHNRPAVCHGISSCLMVLIITYFRARRVSPSANGRRVSAAVLEGKTISACAGAQTCTYQFCTNIYKYYKLPDALHKQVFSLRHLL